jgi:hypothetical protein
MPVLYVSSRSINDNYESINEYSGSNIVDVPNSGVTIVTFDHHLQW